MFDIKNIAKMNLNYNQNEFICFFAENEALVMVDESVFPFRKHIA
jgi:hypothetical protein